MGQYSRGQGAAGRSSFGGSLQGINSSARLIGCSSAILVRVLRGLGIGVPINFGAYSATRSQVPAAVKSAAMASALRSVDGLPLAPAPPQFLDCGQNPAPGCRSDHVATLKQVIGALGSHQGRVVAVLVNQQLRGAIDVRI